MRLSHFKSGESLDNPLGRRGSHWGRTIQGWVASDALTLRHLSFGCAG